MKTTTALFFTLGTLAFGQQPPQPAQPAQPQQPPRPPMELGLRPGPGGKWWDNPEIAKRVGITSDQKKKMDEVFVQSRMRLIDLRASLEKDELTLEPLMQGPALDDSKILPAVDKIAQDRAELEKADVRLLLGIRHILTPEQWATLDQRLEQRDERGPRGGGGRGPGGQQFDRGPGGPGTPTPPPPPRED